MKDCRKNCKGEGALLRGDANLPVGLAHFSACFIVKDFGTAKDDSRQRHLGTKAFRERVAIRFPEKRGFIYGNVFLVLNGSRFVALCCIKQRRSQNGLPS